MNSAIPYMDLDLIKRLKEKYFGDKSKQLSIAKGEYLIRQNQSNDRLYLVLNGLVGGYLESETGTQHEVFQSATNMFVGVHSFFSKTNIVYADVIALQDCKVAYIDRLELELMDNVNYNDEFMPLIVHELYIRQRWAKDVTMEKEATMKKLYHTDKMATLGQMAAGLAHELNNAIGVIGGNSDWITKEISSYIKLSENNEIFEDFQRGYSKGQFLGSSEIREKRKLLEKKYKLPSGTAKTIAKLGLNPEDYKKVDLETLNTHLEKKNEFWQIGVALHDIMLASTQAAHVLKSIKQLSVSDQARYALNINQSLKEALALLKNQIRNIAVDFKTDDALPEIIASGGELIQIWVNIIKNACESMKNSNIKDPQLFINTSKKNKYIVVEITDNGPGISKELQEKIFQPNFTTKKGGLSFGLGLGLSIVQRLVDGYNGKIDVISKKGITKFTVKIPAN